MRDLTKKSKNYKECETLIKRADKILSHIKKKVRKPKSFSPTTVIAPWESAAYVRGEYFNSKQCRKLAAWLLRAALWLEQEGK